LIDPQFGAFLVPDAEEEVPPRQKAIDEAALAADRDPAAIRRVANVNARITDGATDGFLRGPASQVVDDLRRLREDYGFDSFIFSGEGDPDEQLQRFAQDVVPAVRERSAVA
jgi:alkanesulfonate monooxygenase SsuD/methylene tetrahydromethanopterin reductase-like flavin-dependent oxidoreductase (luciferase family)